MELAKQIREHRTRLGLSQEELAGRIYVSRQTISNWETDRTYPDIHSLLLLSTLFAVTVDELLKGDVVAMRKTVDEMKMKAWSWVMLICVVVGLFSVMPAMEYWGNWGLALPLGILAIGTVASFVLEHIKKRNGVHTYSEILSFMDHVPRDEKRIARERQHLVATRVLMGIVSAIIGGVLAYISTFIWT
ncbi:MAG: helix-turn-helix domain-containing protein [Coriobacteriales bacterium]|nr:helix-turn-helix domain-containing protein [Coriobacteriales bacterium]